MTSFGSSTYAVTSSSVGWTSACGSTAVAFGCLGALFAFGFSTGALGSAGAGASSSDTRTSLMTSVICSASVFAPSCCSSGQALASPSSCWSRAFEVAAWLSTGTAVTLSLLGHLYTRFQNTFFFCPSAIEDPPSYRRLGTSVCTRAKPQETDRAQGNPNLGAVPGQRRPHPTRAPSAPHPAPQIPAGWWPIGHRPQPSFMATRCPLHGVTCVDLVFGTRCREPKAT